MAARKPMCLGTVLFLAAIIAASSGYVNGDPVESILVVTPHCGSDKNDKAWIEIKTDLSIVGEAVCKSDQRVAFLSNNSVEYYMPVFYDGSVSGRCVFKKKAAAEIYTILIVVSWGERGSEIHTLEKRYQLTCTFDDKGTIESRRRVVVEPLIASKEVQSYKGALSLSNVTVRLTDVLGDDLPSDGVHIGRKVQLQARSVAIGNELGIHPVACDIVSMTSGNKYAILRGGCGDGIVFKKDQGFKTNGLLTVSPPFKMISFAKDRSVKFHCNFSLCALNCDGDSCMVEKRRRSVHRLEITPTNAETNSINVILIMDEVGNDISKFINLNSVQTHPSKPDEPPSVDYKCIECLDGVSSENVDLDKKADENLPPAGILPNIGTSKREYQSKWPKFLFGSYASTVQSAWPLGLGVLMAIGMFSTLVVALLVVCRDRHGKTAKEADGLGEFDSLLK